MFITSFEEQNITYRSCSNLRIHLCHLTSIRSKEAIYPFFQKITLISKYLEDKNLNNLLISYDDELYLALENYSSLEPMEVFHNFINELQKWQEQTSI